MKSNDPFHGGAMQYIEGLPKDVRRTVITYTLKLLTAARVEHKSDSNILMGLASIEEKILFHLDGTVEEPSGRISYLTEPPHA